MKRIIGKRLSDDLPQGLDLCIFDFGVNAGPSRAVKMIQTMAALPLMVSV